MTRQISRRRNGLSQNTPNAADAFMGTLQPLVGDMMNTVLVQYAIDFLQKQGYVVYAAGEEPEVETVQAAPVAPPAAKAVEAKPPRFRRTAVVDETAPEAPVEAE